MSVCSEIRLGLKLPEVPVRSVDRVRWLFYRRQRFMVNHTAGHRLLSPSAFMQ